MHGSFWHWLQHHLVPCPFKWLTGIDCPGCGFQRSFMALLQGDIQKSVELYPATIPLLLLFAVAFWHKKFAPERGSTIFKILFFLTGSIIAISYILKMYRLHVTI
ncbi:DUF2752 domain-containing protein [Sinomicrobium pectinilyticum]|uniref:DUF2752 domain-containing protein n=1 Tax=Sinomicrobium pectinilyticum TaxID=1084421 RepID=A0A3N0ERT7_SINP1|nr:DUF2752 domain-containing protein [Sinomicrobium pectinilyticum]RNL90648.1 DUF2752 domain-containing protein [Sinomicrobium pectinilyticum]